MVTDPQNYQLILHVVACKVLRLPLGVTEALSQRPFCLFLSTSLCFIVIGGCGAQIVQAWLTLMTRETQMRGLESMG